MTRINLVPVEELMDQHLFAEWREIKMVPKSLNRSIIAARKKVGPVEARHYLLDRIPKEFTLNAGHVSFFYDKGVYLNKRFLVLTDELSRRGFNFQFLSQLDPERHMTGEWCGKDYDPTPEALAIIRQRIKEKIAMQPAFYRYYGKPLCNV